MKILDFDTELTYLFSHNNIHYEPLKAIRIISDEEISVLQKANKILYEFQYYNRRISEINHNYQEYIHTVDEYSQLLSEEMVHSEDIMNEIFVNVNRTFINFISSMKVFVEHIEKRLQKNYGEESDKYQYFKKSIH